jgi:bla regulator protein blaR1
VETLYRSGLSNAISATVLALVVACLARVLWRRPAVLHCLWVLVLVKLVTPPLYDVPVPWLKSSSVNRESESRPHFIVWELDPAATVPPESDDVVSELEADSAMTGDQQPARPSVPQVPALPSIDWLRLAWLIWVTGTVTTMIVSIRRIRRFQVLLRSAEPADVETQEWVDELAASLGLDRSPSVWWVAGKLSPLVWSLSWRPRLILPRELWKALDDHQRATLIIHELAHLRRGDHLIRFLELVVTGLYWWHPVLWWARRALRDVEEQCCDAWVVWALPDAAKSYADTLLETLDFLNPCDLAEPLLASGFGKVQHLRKRLTMIMTGTTPRLVGMWGTLGTLALAVVLLPANASLAQKPEDKPLDDQKDVRVVITSDATATSTSSADLATITSDSATISLDDGPRIMTDFVATVDDAEPGRFFVTVNTDDSKGVVASGSFDEVVAKLKAQRKELAEKKAHTPEDRVRLTAVARALKELEGAAEKVAKVKFTVKKDDERSEARAIAIRRIEADKDMSPEKKAEIEKAAKAVSELAQAVQAKQKELIEAQRKLSKLTGRGNIGGGNVSFKTVTAVPRAQLARDVHVLARPVIERKDTVRRDGESGEKRIDALEKKLEKLLDEVASLKKDRAK